MGRIPKDAYAMIIGAMKCGTSSLYSYLARHPAICPSATKEPEFFSQNQSHQYKGVRTYEDLWNFDPAVHRYALTGSTGYSKYPEKPNVPRKIHDYGLTPKFIYVVRNPFDRIVSQYHHHLRKIPGFDPATPLTYDLFVNISNYFLQLEQYRPYFAREGFLILDFDELKASPRECTAKVYGFLGLPDFVAAGEYSVHNRTKPRTEIILAKNPVLRYGARLSPAPVRRLGKRILRRVLTERTFTEQERETVRKCLTPDMIRFRDEYSFDISKWGWQ